MQIVVAATDEQWKELEQVASKAEWKRVEDGSDFEQYHDAVAFFNLKNDTLLPVYSSLAKKPVFINAVVTTLKELNAPANVLRINGWPGFLKRTSWELAGVVDKNIESIFDKLNIKINAVPDEPGMVAARIIAMIINEAYFAVGDGVSSKAEINTAMKLGTNYPYGPFEWSSLIGAQPIFDLLQKLSTTDIRYQPAELLVKEVNARNS